MIKNLTPHAIDLIDGETIPASGEVARVTMTLTPAGEIDGIPAVRQTYGEIVGLPAPEEGVYLIVSGLIVSAAREAGRTTSDLLTPAEQVRDEQGRVIGCKSLARN